MITLRVLDKGSKWWLANGILHRANGPAVVHSPDRSELLYVAPVHGITIDNLVWLKNSSVVQVTELAENWFNGRRVSEYERMFLANQCS